MIWSNGSRYKGSEVDFPVTSPNNINGKKKKREAINPEPGAGNLLTQSDRMSNLWAITRTIKVYDHFYRMNNEVRTYILSFRFLSFCNF